MAKIAFLGERVSLEFFRLLGGDVFAAETVAEATTWLEELKKRGYATIFVSEEIFEPEVMKNSFLQGEIVVLPAWKKHQGTGQRLMEELIRKATGIK